VVQINNYDAGTAVSILNLSLHFTATACFHTQSPLQHSAAQSHMWGYDEAVRSGVCVNLQKEDSLAVSSGITAVVCLIED